MNDYNDYTDEKKNIFLSDFKNMCADIRNTMDSLLTDERITNDEYHNMIDIIKSLNEYVYSNIEDIRKKGADSMLQEKCVLWSDKIKAEAKAEEKRELAEMMIINEEPAEKIEKYTGLNLSVLKPLAQSLGKTLVI